MRAWLACYARGHEWETRGSHDPKKRCQRCHSERPIHHSESTGLVRFAVVLCYGLAALGYSWLRDAVGRLR